MPPRYAAGSLTSLSLPTTAAAMLRALNSTRVSAAAAARLARPQARTFVAKAAAPKKGLNPIYPAGGVVAVGAVGYTIYSSGILTDPPEESLSGKMIREAEEEVGAAEAPAAGDAEVRYSVAGSALLLSANGSSPQTTHPVA